MQVIVDDNNPAIFWSDAWTLKDNEKGYNSTVHTTLQDGASFTFRFVGTSVTVYGTNPAYQLAEPVVKCTIDAGDPTKSALPFTDTKELHYAFCNKSFLAPLEHTLVFEAIFPQDEGTIHVDYLVYEAAVPSLQAIASSPTSSASTPLEPSFPPSSTNGTVFKNPIASSSPSAHASVRLSVATLLGVIVAVCIVSSGFTAGAMLIWRRRRSPRSALEPELPSSQDPIVSNDAGPVGPSAPQSPMSNQSCNQLPNPSPRPSSSSTPLSGPSSAPAVYNMPNCSPVPDTPVPRPCGTYTYVQENLRMGRQSLQGKLGEC